MTVIQKRLGDVIREVRMKRGYTQEKLAEMLEVTPSHLKQMEGGKRNPSVPLLFHMMKILDFSVDALVFPDRKESDVIHTDGLTQAQCEALIHLVDTIKE